MTLRDRAAELARTLDALSVAHGHRGQAAVALGVSRRTVLRAVRELGERVGQRAAADAARGEPWLSRGGKRAWSRAKGAGRERSMSEHLFGVGWGKVSDETRAKVEAALPDGVSFTNPTLPGQGPRYWFAAPNRGDPFNGRMARDVAEQLELVGLDIDHLASEDE